MAAPDTTPAELRHAATQDVSWSLAVMANQVLALASAPDAELPIRAALLEAALGHMRALLEFLTFAPHDQYIRASDYGASRQSAPPRLYATISGHLTHLSWARVRKPSPDLPMVTTAGTVLEMFKTFHGGLPDEPRTWFAAGIRDAEHALEQARTFDPEPVARNTTPPDGPLA